AADFQPDANGQRYDLIEPGPHQHSRCQQPVLVLGRLAKEYAALARAHDFVHRVGADGDRYFAAGRGHRGVSSRFSSRSAVSRSIFTMSSRTTFETYWAVPGSIVSVTRRQNSAFPLALGPGG